MNQVLLILIGVNNELPSLLEKKLLLLIPKQCLIIYRHARYVKTKIKFKGNKQNFEFN